MTSQWIRLIYDTAVAAAAAAAMESGQTAYFFPEPYLPSLVDRPANQPVTWLAHVLIAGVWASQ